MFVVIVAWMVLAGALSVVGMRAFDRWKLNQRTEAYREVLHEKKIERRAVRAKAHSDRPIPNFARSVFGRPQSRPSVTEVGFRTQPMITRHVGGILVEDPPPSSRRAPPSRPHR